MYMPFSMKRVTVHLRLHGDNNGLHLFPWNNY